MQPYKVEFYLYAADESQAQHVQQALREFVECYRQRGIAVSAEHVSAALSKFKDNYFVTQYLKRKL
jgi:hypothetical protein